MDLSWQIHTLHLPLHMIPQWEPCRSYRKNCILWLCTICKFIFQCSKTCDLVSKCMLSRQLSAFTVKVACQCRKCHNSTVILEPILMMRDRGTVFVNRHRLALMDHLTGSFYHFIRNTCQLFDIGLIKSSCIFCIFFKAMNIFINVFFVDPAFPDQYISHTQCQGTVCSRIWAQMQITHFFCSWCDLRIYYNDLHSP